LSTWRRQRRQGELEALAPKRRGPKVVVSPLHLENRKLLAINIRLTQRLKNAELIIEVQKKVAALLGNQLRAFLLERGLVFAKSPAKLRERMPEILENAEEDLTPRMRNLLALLWNEWKDLEQQVVDLNHEVERIASSDAAWASAKRKQEREIYSRNSQSLTASPAEPGELPIGLARRTGCGWPREV
jgi:hypothetical protein